MKKDTVTSPVQTFTRTELKGKSLYVVGDIHGCYDELLELEEKIEKHASTLKLKPFLICVGDYCDRGPESSRVIEYISKGQKAGTHTGVLGNHEFYFLLVNATMRLAELEEHSIVWPPYLLTCAQLYQDEYGKAPSPKDLQKAVKHLRDRWRDNGGETTMNSYGTSLDDPKSHLNVPIEQLQFLLQCPVVIETPWGIVSHAQMHHTHLQILKNALPKDTEDPYFTFRRAVDSCIWNRELPDEPVAGKLWHFSGHTPTPTVKRSFKNRWARLDTGCVYGNKLTALHMQSRKALSVPAHETYKPKSISP